MKEILSFAISIDEHSIELLLVSILYGYTWFHSIRVSSIPITYISLTFYSCRHTSQVWYNVIQLLVFRFNFLCRIYSLLDSTANINGLYFLKELKRLLYEFFLGINVVVDTKIAWTWLKWMTKQYMYAHFILESIVMNYKIRTKN